MTEQSLPEAVDIQETQFPAYEENCKDFCSPQTLHDFVDQTAMLVVEIAHDPLHPARLVENGLFLPDLPNNCPHLAMRSNLFLLKMRLEIGQVGLVSPLGFNGKELVDHLFSFLHRMALLGAGVAVLFVLEGC